MSEGENLVQVIRRDCTSAQLAHEDGEQTTTTANLQNALVLELCCTTR